MLFIGMHSDVGFGGWYSLFGGDIYCGVQAQPTCHLSIIYFIYFMECLLFQSPKEEGRNLAAYVMF